VVLDRPVARSFRIIRGFRRKLAVVLWGRAYRHPLPDITLCLSFVWASRDKKRSASFMLSVGLPVVLRPTVEVDRSGPNWGVTLLWLLGGFCTMWSTVDGAKGVAAAQNARLAREVQP